MPSPTQPSGPHPESTQQSTPPSEGIWYLRRWLTILQDHYRSGDKPFLDHNRNSGPIHEVLHGLDAFRTALSADSIPPRTRQKIERALEKATAAFSALDHNTSPTLRLAGLIWVIPFVASLLYIAAALDEWGQFITQSAVLSRTLSLAAALLLYKKSNPTIIAKHYEYRIVGSMPSVVMYSFTTVPRYRHLHGDWHYTLIVGVLTTLVLFLISFTKPLAHRLIRLWSKSQPPLQGEPRTHLKAAHDALTPLVTNLHALVEDNRQISDNLRHLLLFAKGATDNLLKATNALLPPEDAIPRPRYPRRSKLPHLLVTVALFGISLGASYRYPWYLAETAGWGIWNTTHILLAFLSRYTSKKDTAHLFSNIVVGSLIVLPLNLTILITNGAVLLPLLNKILFTIGLILFALLGSNLLGDLCTWIGEKI